MGDPHVGLYVYRSPTVNLRTYQFSPPAKTCTQYAIHLYIRNYLLYIVTAWFQNGHLSIFLGSEFLANGKSKKEMEGRAVALIPGGF